MPREQIFGFQIQSKEKVIKSPVPQQRDDGTDLPVGGVVGYAYDNLTKARTEHQLIRQYRDMSLHPEADAAIDDIVNESFSLVYDKSVVSIRLDQLNIDKRIKETIRNEFQEILYHLRFQKKSYEIFKQWYVDGRLYYQVVIDERNPRDGIKELRPIDALKIRRDVIPEWEPDEKTGVPYLKNVEEFFTFSPDGDVNNGVKMSKDSVLFCPSGMVDRNRGTVISYLDKAIKPFNNLQSMEDALIIYRIARAPERRIFYVDVGQMPKIKAEQYLRDMMNRYRNKIDYDPRTGNIRDSRKFMSLLEDFWLPRRDGSKGTEISTLPGGANLSELDDVLYFKEKLYQSLNVPISRVNQDNQFQLGRASDISRDEVKFSKFIRRLRKHFGELFNEALRIQLVLKGICTVAEFERIRQYIVYDFLKDAHFEELKNLEVLQDRLNLLRDAQDYVGKYYSIEYIRKNVLGQTEDDIDRLDKEMQYELEKGALQEPGDEPGGMWDSFTTDRTDSLTEETEVVVETKEATTFGEINNKEQRDYQRLMESIRDELNN